MIINETIKTILLRRSVRAYTEPTCPPKKQLEDIVKIIK